MQCATANARQLDSRARTQSNSQTGTHARACITKSHTHTGRHAIRNTNAIAFTFETGHGDVVGCVCERASLAHDGEH